MDLIKLYFLKRNKNSLQSVIFLRSFCFINKKFTMIEDGDIYTRQFQNNID